MTHDDSDAGRDTRRVVDAFLDAFAAHDFDRAAGLLSERVVYEGPVDRFEDRASFVGDLEKYGQIVRRVERRRLFVEGSEACVIMTVLTTIPEIARTRMAVWVVVEDGAIVRMEGFLDARAYARLVGAG